VDLLKVNPAALKDALDLARPKADAEHANGRALEAVSEAPPLEFVNPTIWENEPVPKRQWLVRNRIPAGNVTLLTGDGAAGKTTIALQLVAATVRGTDWLGAVIERPGPVIFFSAEEDFDEIHRRLAAILVRESIPFRELDGVHLLCMPGDDAVLGSPDKGGAIRPTSLFQRLEQAVRKIQPTLMVVEAAADVFAGNENDRSQVRQFIALLRRLARTSGAAVLLLAHPSVAGMASGTGTSGSTGWNNSARSRMYFLTAKRGEEDDDPDVRELRMMKSNYGPKGEVVKVRFDRGAFAIEGRPSTLERIATEATIDQAFLRCLDSKNAQGIAVVPTRARGYAPAVFEAMPEANGFKSRALGLAMERLLSSRQIRVETSGPPSKPRSALVRCTR
jgi:RecA-family ATPase